MKTIQAAKSGYIISSLAFCAAGIFLVVYPEVSARALCYLVGGLLIVCGVMKLVGYWSRDPYQLAFQFDLAFGLLSLVMGLVMVLHPFSVIRLVYFAIGIVALTDGLLKLQTALDARRFGIRKWWLIIAAAVLTSLFGLLLILDPFAGGMWLLTMAGLTMLLEGILNLCVGICTVKVMKKEMSRMLPGEEL
ncbi:MAG: hypothetical protein HFI31_04500 [Lachnospiraceae bacterium]|nr:hypothetical protein [Lachnospiraceae bacterium]